MNGDPPDVPDDDLLERLRLSIEQACARRRLVRADLLSPVLRIPDVDGPVTDLDAVIEREEC